MISQVGASIKGYWRNGVEYTGRVVDYIGDSLLHPGKVASKWIHYEPTAKPVPKQPGKNAPALTPLSFRRQPVSRRNTAREEIARLDALIAEQRATLMQTAARDFANKQILAGRVFPYAFDVLQKTYMQALMDDRDMPLATRARASDLEVMCEKLTAHDLTKERVPGLPKNITSKKD
jgi:hypothetical protein